ncbi:hypothetical protein BLA60_30880 [Actinophytocola xinjiangensis]|uniref:Propionyl-CoA carboxylase alpha chain n=1 Tax=Actinophytocola xinjiangensis TaxID=485602 RepID=A0A7Z1AWN4_9PSEU|nr:hypothetical protein BLA60_30880 [Actinophytocola xinjiangensis]
MIRTLFVANRGEIARRVIRTARRMGIDTTVGYADPDAGAPFVREADRAVPLGGSTGAQTYLDSAKLLAAARRTGADAVHPGYGFLSENAAFATAVGEAGLTWVGPSPSAIAAMGDKLTALETMAAAGVPTLPRAAAGADVVEAARTVGYPLIVKASAGGGGKGMRIVTSEDDLTEAVTAARRESAGAFGDDTVFLERFVPGGRHIEVQILGDAHGTVRHLHERECSIQRRHQKIVEECPSPFVDPDLRAAMCAAAVAAGQAVGYQGAGTVEFIVGADGSYHFLEMNTRLQVEHPVTELVTGVDLVRQQLLVAQGDPLELPARVPLRGHAVEVRLYAEDHDFLPQTGTIVEWAEPDGVRVDSGVERGSVVGPHFDPMLAKVIAHGPTRGEAVRRLERALRRLRVHGVATNRDLLVAILAHEAFLAGDTTTDFLDTHRPARVATPSADQLRAAALSAALADRERHLAGLPDGRAIPRSLPAGYRNNRSQGQVTGYRHRDTELTTSLWTGRDGTVVAEVDGRELRARVHGWAPPLLDVEIDGVRDVRSVVADGDRVWVADRDHEVELVVLPRFPGREAQVVPGGLTAPMHGLVSALEVAQGDRVREGQTIVVIEAMKMEHRLTAPADGVVERVLTAPGATVATDEVLAVLVPVGDA